jgi:hypothetical protein
MVAPDHFHRAFEELTITGVKETAHALNERRVRRLVLCANLRPPSGWQCHDCLAVYLSAHRTECKYCRSTNIRMGDLKSVMIARAYRMGCAIEVKSQCPELERLGGIGVLLDERYLNFS